MQPKSVFHFCLHHGRNHGFADSRLFYVRKPLAQAQTAVKFSGSSLAAGPSTTVRAEMWVRGVGPRDSVEIIDPFMHVVNYTTRHLATLRELELLPPFTSPYGFFNLFRYLHWAGFTKRTSHY